MLLNFTKMHGLGNDFVVFDGINQSLDLTDAQIRLIADRHFGVGCDQLLVVEAAQGDADFRYRIFNADGGEVEQCGNGARCFARFVRDKGLTDQDRIRVETLGGLLELVIEADHEITVNMGVPHFEPEAIPFEAKARASHYLLTLEQDTVKIGTLSMGNPHAVILVDDIDRAEVAHLGPLIERHERFPNRVNAGFMQVVDRAHIHLRVYERGVGETLACGSGACAAMVTARQWGLVDDTVTVRLHGGSLSISWAGEGAPVMMTGPVVTVFEGHIDLEAL